MKSGVKYPITWIDGSLFKPKVKFWVGVCHYEKKPAFITRDGLEIAMVQDLYVEGNNCEENRRCLNFDCKYNKTTFDTFRSFKGAKGGKNIKKIFDDRIYLPSKINVEGFEFGAEGGVITRKGA